MAIVDPLLKQAIYNYTMVKLESQAKLYKKAPFIVSQQNGRYSPNTMQQLMAKIYRKSPSGSNEDRERFRGLVEAR